MKAKDVMNLPWKNVTDWSELPASDEDLWLSRKYHYVCSTDVSVFVENVFMDIARKLGIPYEELQPILASENKAFYTLKERLFKVHTGYLKSSARLIELENTLKVPDISNIETAVTQDNVSICLKLFGELSDIEKTVFLQKIGKIHIKVECFPIESEETMVD